MVTIVIVEFCAMNADREPARSLIAASIAAGEKAYGEASRGEPPSASAAEMAVLTALEDEARRLGYRRARLDTGPRQPRARGLDESTGYVAIVAYDHNPLADFWAEKRL